MIDSENIPRRQQQTIQQSISQRNYDRERSLLAEASPVFESDEVIATLISLATCSYYFCVWFKIVIFLPIKQSSNLFKSYHH